MSLISVTVENVEYLSHFPLPLRSWVSLKVEITKGSAAIVLYGGEEQVQGVLVKCNGGRNKFWSQLPHDGHTSASNTRALSSPETPAHGTHY